MSPHKEQEVSDILHTQNTHYVRNNKKRRETEGEQGGGFIPRITKVNTPNTEAPASASVL